MLSHFKLNINGKVREVEVDPTTPILWVLRDHLDLVGTKYGCWHSFNVVRALFT